MLRERCNVRCGSGARLGRTAKRPFTLIELLVVMALIVFLMGLLVAGIVVVYRKVGDTQCRALIKEMSLAMDNYKKKMGYYPPSLNFATSVKDYSPLMVKTDPSSLELTDFIPDFQKMVSAGIFVKVSTGYYKLYDPYGSRMYYQAPGIHNRSSFDLCSSGPDGDIEETTDNINNWE